MIANKRGKYYSLNKVVDSQSYEIDVDDFKWHIRHEQDCVAKDILKIQSLGLIFVDVSYEDYVSNRDHFYGCIFNMLDFPLIIPPPSDLLRVIDDLRQTIKNYGEVETAARELGIEI
jgi:hypothetical protein